MTIFIETDRLQLRAWRENDLEQFAAMNVDKRVMTYFPATLNREQSDAFVTRTRESFKENGFGFYAVAEKTSSRFIGFVGLSRVRFSAAFTPAVEIGWRLAFRAWGRGYATEAAAACLANGFSEFGLREIVSFTARLNHRSAAVMTRIGMSRDPADDFEHPSLPDGHWLRRHVLYRINNSAP